ncbi:MAG: phosphotransferase [Pseudomonadota bacterium]|nr:phosphotransferase [Pseudomonadota bacterium]MDO7710027.1 phosphotransferase [Pseudomonadota bacterium]
MSYIVKDDTRIDEVHHWLKTVFPSTHYTLESASNDASFRRYFRVTVETKTWILMDAPPVQEDTRPFIDIGTFLYEHGIHVPKIYARETEAGFLLLSDFGSTPYLDELKEKSADSLYKAAIDSLIKIQLCPSQDIHLPVYDSALLQQEMNLFPDWFLDTHLNIAVPQFLQTTYNHLISSALEQPQVIVHRDYHSRNLMHTAENSPGIIDFQDAVIGAISYDLVSLLRDCYISWPEDKITEWIQYYLSKAQQQGLLPNIAIEQFTQWFDWMGLQRHIKVLGIFCRLNYRDGKANYMNDLPLTLAYVRKITAKYPEFSELNSFLQQESQIVAIS